MLLEFPMDSGPTVVDTLWGAAPEVDAISLWWLGSFRSSIGCEELTTAVLEEVGGAFLDGNAAV